MKDEIMKSSPEANEQMERSFPTSASMRSEEGIDTADQAKAKVAPVRKRREAKKAHTRRQLEAYEAAQRARKRELEEQGKEECKVAQNRF